MDDIHFDASKGLRHRLETREVMKRCLPWRDEAEIWRILHASYERDDIGIICAIHDGHVVGVGLWERQDWSLSAYSLYMAAVLPAYRGRGIGRTLIERRLQAIAVASGGRDVWVDAATRCPARLERHGFRTVDTLPDGLTRMTLRLPRPVGPEKVGR